MRSDSTSIHYFHLNLLFRTTSSAAAASATAASLNYRQLEEAINKWTLELEEQEKVFLNQATQVNAWDRMLMDNGEKIVKLHESVEKVKLDQQVMDIFAFLCFLKPFEPFFKTITAFKNSSIFLN